MRRKDREETDFQTVLGMIDQCEIMRIGLADGEYPYIVPVNFAYRAEGERLALYFHGAQAGRKYELMKRSGKCSFEMDVPVRMECISETGSVTQRYECVMGTADIEFLEGDEKRRAMDEIIMARYEMTRNFDYNKEVLAKTAVIKLSVTQWSAKRNPIPDSGDIS